MATIELPTIINEEYFKQYSPIPENYDIREIKPFFKVAEQLWVLPLLGQALYDELLEQVCANEITPENSTLLLVIYPYLSFAICYEALPFISYHFSQVGVTKGKSDNSDSVSINDVNFISTQLRSQVETMKGQLKKFLDQHSDVYPLYKPDDCGGACDTVCDDCGWIADYYGSGRYDWQYFRALYTANRNKPNPRLQVHSTRRINIDIN